MEKNPITPAGAIKLREELHHRKSVERPLIVNLVAAAREHGDLKENAEYHAARDRHGFNEGRIRELEDKIGRIEVIDPSKLSGDRIAFGAHVKLSNTDTDEQVSYQIVGLDEADLKHGTISVTSPVARSLLGKSPGDEVKIRTPGGERIYEVLEVEYR